MSDSYKPRNYSTVTSYFIAKDAAGLMDFLKQVFYAEELSRNSDNEGRITHAEVRIGDSIIELSEANDQFPARTNTLHLFVADTDECYTRALAAGAASLYAPANMPYGERSGGIEDPFGNHWYLATFTGGEGNGYD
ncbi:VOC family protein [Paenibacillus sepulcri]|uniref:VOC family protein n=1 Tax=Paenibacillus sepulcri TaxID=359917 RepID=A0ABS7C610_9BACL|nr:VOC family protein [Paenibacillus sepulcri]